MHRWTMTRCKFTFDDGHVWNGFSHGSTWNGFDNVAVTKDVAVENGVKRQQTPREFLPA